jgi:hypothetical protein
MTTYRRVTVAGFIATLNLVYSVDRQIDDGHAGHSDGRLCHSLHGRRRDIGSVVFAIVQTVARRGVRRQPRRARYTCGIALSNLE